MATKKGEQRRARPATTPEGRENQLISLAVDLVEKRLEAGTASAAEVVHLLKLGSTRERLEQERLKNENLLLTAKADQIGSAERNEALLKEAIKAFTSYSGQDEGNSSDDVY